MMSSRALTLGTLLQSIIKDDTATFFVTLGVSKSSTEDLSKEDFEHSEHIATVVELTPIIGQEADVAKENTKNQKHLATVVEHINIIDAKAIELWLRNFSKEAKIARKLAINITTELQQYANAPTEENLEQFKISSKALIKAARPTLEKHRGWKKILGNIGLALATLGVGYLVASGIKTLVTGRPTFFNDTDSSKKIKALSKEIKAIKP